MKNVVLKLGCFFGAPAKILTLSICLLNLVPCLTAAAGAEESKAIDVLREIPVQHGGRIKPFDSFARETVLFVTGKHRFEKTDPAEMVWSWIARPADSSNQPLIRVAFPALQEEFGIMLVKERISPEILLGHGPFLKQLEVIQNKQARKEPLTEIEKKRLELYERAVLFSQIARGYLPGFLAHPGEMQVSWLPLEGLTDEATVEKLGQMFPAEGIKAVSSELRQLINATAKDIRSAEAYQSALGFSKALRDLFAAEGIILDQKLMRQEVQYNRWHLFGLAWKVYLLAFLLMVLAHLLPGKKFWQISGMTLTVLALILHTYGFYLRCVIAGRPPVSNMYESVIWVSWGGMFFALMFFFMSRVWFLPVIASLVAALGLLVADGFPAVLDPSISPLVPVLRSNMWLTVHVLTITLSYGAFLLAWGIGHAIVFMAIFGKKKNKEQPGLIQYLYRTLQAGVILLAAGTILGGVWANYSWGRFWGWDPKETWALIALLGYLAVLHARYVKWIGSFGLAVCSVAAFLGVLMAWYGVNFVLAAGLHSYGFGGGGAAYVFGVALADLALILGLAYIHRYPKK